MSPKEQEAAILENIVPQLQSEGFEVFAHPSARMLPQFMRGYTPDAIAMRDDRKLAIEITGEGERSKERLVKIQALFEGHNDWELRVYWISPSDTPKPIESVNRSTIEQSVRSVEELAQSGRAAPALLMAWATFEAVGRALLPNAFVRPQTPGRLVEVLASEGHLTPDEADLLRQLADLRNRLIHGGLHLKIDPTEINRFVEALKGLSKQIPDRTASVIQN